MVTVERHTIIHKLDTEKQLCSWVFIQKTSLFRRKINFRMEGNKLNSLQKQDTILMSSDLYSKHRAEDNVLLHFRKCSKPTECEKRNQSDDVRYVCVRRT